MSRRLVQEHQTPLRVYYHNGISYIDLFNLIAQACPRLQHGTTRAWEIVETHNFRASLDTIDVFCLRQRYLIHVYSLHDHGLHAVNARHQQTLNLYSPCP